MCVHPQRCMYFFSGLVHQFFGFCKNLDFEAISQATVIQTILGIHNSLPDLLQVKDLSYSDSSRSVSRYISDRKHERLAPYSGLRQLTTSIASLLNLTGRHTALILPRYLFHGSTGITLEGLLIRTLIPTLTVV